MFRRNVESSDTSEHRYSSRYEKDEYEKRKAEFIYGGSQYSSPSQREHAWNMSHQNQERKYHR